MSCDLKLYLSSSDLAISVFILLRKFKKFDDGKKYEFNEDVFAAANEYFDQVKCF